MILAFSYTSIFVYYYMGISPVQDQLPIYDSNWLTSGYSKWYCARPGINLPGINVSINQSINQSILTCICSNLVTHFPPLNIQNFTSIPLLPHVISSNKHHTKCSPECFQIALLMLCTFKQTNWYQICLILHAKFGYDIDFVWYYATWLKDGISVLSIWCVQSHTNTPAHSPLVWCM